MAAEDIPHIVVAGDAVSPWERYGIPAQAKEPAAFAYLALCALRRKPNHLPETTGATSQCILGTLTPGA